MTDRIPTESGPDSYDPAYKKQRQHPVITAKGIEQNDIVVSTNEYMDDQWKVEGISNGKATVKHVETGDIARVQDSWFKSVEKVD